MMKYCTLISGSSGNVTYIGGADTHILIDAGASARAIAQALGDMGLMLADISAVFITHEHSDHIRGVDVLHRRHRLPVFMTEGTLLGSRLALEPDGIVRAGVGMDIGGLHVLPFSTPHDGLESVGYRVYGPGGVSIGVATDMGHVADEVLEAMSGCDAAVIESNHDVGMLYNGRYPYMLKRRILSANGHLSNEDGASLGVALCRAGARTLTLAHLSEENNLPELAFETARCALYEAGATGGDVAVSVAPRNGPSRLFEVG